MSLVVLRSVEASNARTMRLNSHRRSCVANTIFTSNITARTFIVLLQLYPEFQKDEEETNTQIQHPPTKHTPRSSSPA